MPTQNPWYLLGCHYQQFNLWEATGQAPARQQIMSRKWAWIGYTLRRSKDCIAQQALGWNPQGSRRRGRPGNSWRRDTDHTIQSRGLSWHQLEHLSRERLQIRTERRPGSAFTRLPVVLHLAKLKKAITCCGNQSAALAAVLQIFLTAFLTCETDDCKLPGEGCLASPRCNII